MARPEVASFLWTEAPDRLRALASEMPLAFDRKRGVFLGEATGSRGQVTFVPPRAVPLPASLIEPADDDSAQAFARRVRQADAGVDAVETYLAAFPESLPSQCMILLQAGATALAMFEDGEPVATKAFKRYVVRGNGRAQPAYLASKGKSRYGSRLRLQNARYMVEETNARLTALWNEHGAPDQILVSAPPRLWADLFMAPNPPPFAKDTPVTKVALDVPVPTTAVALRAYRSLLHGRIERAD